MWWILMACGAPVLQSGDIVFQDSQSAQSVAIKAATRSEWSHVGVVVERSDGLYVFEAVSTVRLTPLEDWLERGRDGEYGVRRLDRELTDDERRTLLETGETMLGRPYDLAFSWGDERLYCSELVTKLYASIDVDLGELERVDSFGVTDEAVVAQMAERGIHGDALVVSPASIYADVDLIAP